MEDNVPESVGAPLDNVEARIGANNELLCQWTAVASGRLVLAGPVEATLLGNLLVQARALGELSSIAEGRGVVARSFAQTEYAPSGDARWQEARERFDELRAAEVPV